MNEELGLSKEGLSKTELERFFQHLDMFCAECRGVPKGRTAESCKRPRCILYSIRLMPAYLKTHPKLLDQLLLQSRTLEVEKPDTHTRERYPMR